MIRVCVARLPVDYDLFETAQTDHYAEWCKTEFGQWVHEHSKNMTTYFGLMNAAFSHQMEYVAEFTEQDYCMLQLKYGNQLPKGAPSWA